MPIVQLLFSLRGRLNRKPFWLFQLPICVMVAMVEYHLDSNPLHIDTRMPGWRVPIAADIVFCIIVLVLSIKRLHDRNLSGWWMLPIGLVPVVGPLCFLIVAALPGDAGSNRFGSNPLQARPDMPST
jgi:uncharacterized membrane protein YhaH (DUF805 family)